MAQRRGGGGGAPARPGGGVRGGGGVPAGPGGGFRGAGGFRGGIGFSGYRGGLGYGSFGYRGYAGGYYQPYAYPAFGYGLSYWPSYYNDYPYTYSYPVYQPAPNVTVVYPAQAPAAPATVYVERARPVSHEYDEYGQEVKPASNAAAPTYLVAFKDHSIRAAEAYWVDGGTLHYVTLQHEQKQAPLDTVDREFSLQLNRERRVPFQLPAQ